MILDTNLTNKASGQYLNFDFNSACLFNGNVILAGDDGLFKHTGDLDGTAKIPSYFEPIETDLGVSNPKRLRAIVVSYESVSALTVTVTSELNESYIGSLPGTNGENKIAELKPGRNLYGRYFTFQIKSSGGFFAVEYVEAVPNILAHRRGV